MQTLTFRLGVRKKWLDRIVPVSFVSEAFNYQYIKWRKCSGSMVLSLKVMIEISFVINPSQTGGFLPR